MQANHWADLLTTTPRNQAMHYEPSSPRAPPLLSQSPRAHTASASVHTGSSGDAQQTRVPTHSDHTRVHTTRSDSTRSGYTSSDQMRGATPRPTSVAPATHKVANRQRPTNPGVDQGPHLVQTHHPHVTKPQASRAHAREPHAAPDQPWAKSRSASQSEKSLSRQPHRATAPRKGKTSHIFCGNNILSPKLRRNGGDMEIGSPSQCFRKGFGAGFYQEIAPAHLEDFLADNSGPYKRYIEQPLYYGDGPVPAGEIRATLSQCRSRGFGVGSVQRAKKILKERKHGISKA